MKLRDLLDKEKFAEIKIALKRRGFDGDLSKVVKLEKKRLEMIPKIDELRAMATKLAKAKDVEGGKMIKNKLKAIEPEHKELIKTLDKLKASIPNIPNLEVPDGGEGDGKVLDVVGNIPKIDNPKDHVELGKKLDIIDIERSAKVSGSRFCYLKNQAVELEFALIRYAQDILKDKGFKLLIGPQLLEIGRAHV